MKFIPSQETLNKFTSIATILSLVALPIVITKIGSEFQSSISSEGLKKDYVNMAIQILAQEPKNGDQEDLRKWAIEILSKNSPVPFTPALKIQLKAKTWLGEIKFRDSKLYVPPEELMKPPSFPEKIDNKSVEEKLKRSLENADRLQELQNWISKRRDEEVDRNKFFSDLDAKATN